MKEQFCQYCKRLIVNGGEEFYMCGACTTCQTQNEEAYTKLTWQEKLYCKLFKNAIRSYNRGRGSDPYAGETYTLAFGKLEFEVSSVVLRTVTVSWNGKDIYRKCAMQRKEFNWFGRFVSDVGDALEHNYQINYECDEYGSLAYYE